MEEAGPSTSGTSSGPCFVYFDPIEEDYDEEETDKEEEVEEKQIEDTIYLADDHKDQDFVPSMDQSPQGDPYPTVEKKRQIIEYWKSAKKLKTLEQMQHRYRKLNTIRTLYKWVDQLEQGSTHNYDLFKK